MIVTASTDNPDSLISVVMSADSAYFDGLLVTMASMAEYASPDKTIEWLVLDGGISDSDYVFLEKAVCSRHKKSKFQRISFDKHRTGKAKDYHGSVMTYARLYLAELFPDKTYVLYCDVDFLWRADVAKLWDLRSETQCVLSTRDEWLYLNGDSEEESWFVSRGLDFKRDWYFCAGLCFFNLRRIRQHGFDKEFHKFLERHPDARLADQTVMNAVLPASEIGLVPPMWQRFISTVEPAQLNCPYALHYAGGAPWSAKCNIALLTDAAMLWFREYAKLRGISTWKAICRIHNPLFAAFSRCVFKFATTTKLTFQIFCKLMRLIKKDGYIIFCRKLL